MSIYNIVPSKEAKKVALARLEGEVLDWMRDLCHQIETTIDQERQNL